METTYIDSLLRILSRTRLMCAIELLPNSFKAFTHLYEPMGGWASVSNTEECWDDFLAIADYNELLMFYKSRTVWNLPMSSANIKSFRCKEEFGMLGALTSIDPFQQA